MARYQLAEQRFARPLGGALLLFAVASCDGAGLTLSTSKLTFDAPDTCSTPSGQTVHASVPAGTGKVFVNITFVGPAVASIPNVDITSDTTGEATVFPARADELGPGTYTSVITVKVCTTDPTCATGQLPGSPRTIAVSYTVDALAPVDDPALHTLEDFQLVAERPQGGRLFALGASLFGVDDSRGDNLVTWRSIDGGQTWTRVVADGPPAVVDYALANADDAVYLSGGHDKTGARSGAVWRFDGSAWQFVADAGFPPRERHAMVAHGEQLYVLGGRGDAGFLDDVWASDDHGASWQEVATTRFSPRADPCVVALGDELFVLGGNTITGLAPSELVWRSTDGAVWTEVPVPLSSPFQQAAGGHSKRCVAHAGRMYYFGRNANVRCHAQSVSSADGLNWQVEGSLSPAEIVPTAGVAAVGEQLFTMSDVKSSMPHLFVSSF